MDLSPRPRVTQIHNLNEDFPKLQKLYDPVVHGSTLLLLRNIKQLPKCMAKGTEDNRSSKKQAAYISEAEGRCFFCSVQLVIIGPVEVLARVTCTGRNKDNTAFIRRKLRPNQQL